MFDRAFEKDVAITGIGQSEVGRPSSKSAMRLTLDACLEAIADAGLQREDIDGVACWPGDNNNGNSFSPVGPNALLSALGLKVNWYGGGYEGPGPLAGVINGAMAIAAGLCRHVLVFRTITEASGRAQDKTASALTNKTIGRDSSYFWQWYTPLQRHFRRQLHGDVRATPFPRLRHATGSAGPDRADLPAQCGAQPQGRVPLADEHGRLLRLEDDLHAAAHVRLRRSLRRVDRNRALAHRCSTRRPACADTHRGHRLGAAPALVLGPDLADRDGRVRCRTHDVVAHRPEADRRGQRAALRRLLDPHDDLARGPGPVPARRERPLRRRR